MTITAILSDPIVNGLGLILAVVGIVMACVFYRRGQVSREPSWDTKAVNLIRHTTSALNGLKLSYRGRKVANVTVCRVIFWNNGRKTIDRDDIPPLDPLRIEADPDVEILHVSILAANSPANAFKVLPVNDHHTALLDFDYLDKENGAVIQLIHDGVDSSKVSIAGTVKGARITRRPIAKASPSRFFQPWVRTALVLTVSYIVIAGTVLCDLAYLASSLATGKLTSQFLPILFLSLPVALTALVWISQWRNPCPRGLEAYLDDPTPNADAA